MSSRILIVQNNAMAREALRLRLKNEGYEVFSASGAEQGLALASEHPMDVVVVDDWLPGISGLDFVDELLTAQKNASCRVILLSALGFPEIVRRAVDAGVSDFLVKPVDPEVVAQRLRRMVGGK